ncbi:MAG: phage antirepressor [Rhodoglobus sp.]
MSADLIQHAFNGQAVRVITDEHGEPWFVAGDVATILGYSMASAMIRRLDDDEKGVRPLHTLGGSQMQSVITEAGLYSAILGSSIPGARDFKRWVTHELLPEIRRTGSYAIPQTREQRLALAVIDAQAMLTESNERIAELEPPAAAWTALAESIGDYSMRDTAQILSRDASIEIGQNRLAKFLRQVGWIDPRGIPYQHHVNVGRMQAKPQTRVSHRTGERVACEPQVRITIKGLGALHSLLHGTEPLALDEQVAA